MSTFDPMNPAGFNYTGQSQVNNWSQPQQYRNFAAATQPQIRPVTNAIFVTSLEEALIKTTERNSDIIYFHQDKNEFYRIKVDMEGRKSWAAFTYSFPDQEDNTPATKADIMKLLTRIEALEVSKEVKTATRKKKEVIDNVESDGQRTIFTFDSAQQRTSE